MIRNRVLLTLAAILMIIWRSLGLVRLRLGVVDPSDDRIARRTGHDGCEINDQREVSQRTAPHGARAAIRFAETQRTRTTSIVSIADTLPLECARPMSPPLDRPEEPVSSEAEPQGPVSNGGLPDSAPVQSVQVDVEPKVPATRKATSGSGARQSAKKASARVSNNGGKGDQTVVGAPEDRSKDIEVSTFTKVFYAMLAIVCQSALMSNPGALR